MLGMSMNGIDHSKERNGAVSENAAEPTWSSKQNAATIATLPLMRNADETYGDAQLSNESQPGGMADCGINGDRIPEQSFSFRYSRGDYHAEVSEIALPGFDAKREQQVVMLHGMVESPQIWREIADKIAPMFRTGFEVSMPWHCEQGYLWGLEAKPDEWLEPVLDALPPGRKVVVAHSFGANALISILQRQARDDIDALILLSPYYKPDFEIFTWDFFRRFVGEFEAFVAASIRVRPGAERITASSLAMLVDKVKEKYGSYSWMEFYDLYARTPSLKLGSLKMPVLIMGGDRDLSIIPDDLLALTKRIENARFELLNNCGHFGMVEQPDILTAHIVAFLSNS